MATYEDGHTHCFACGDHKATGGDFRPGIGGTPGQGLIPFGSMQFVELPDRRLWHATTSCFKYGVCNADGEQIATYYDYEGRPIGQKVRGRQKNFHTIGDVNKAMPWGAQCWARSGKKIVVTEGEIDAMSVSQVQNNSWPVVSIACGAGPQVKKYMARHREYFANFEEIILMFDNDDPGQRAIHDAATALSLPTGRVKVATLPLKDANDMLKEGRGDEVYQAIWKAIPWKPVGYLAIEDLSAEILKGPEVGADWPWPGLTQSTFGRRPGEIFTLGAGTGIGKSTLYLQVAGHIAQTERVGLIMLETPPKQIGLRLASTYAKKSFFVPDGSWTEEELHHTLDELSGKVLIYDTAAPTDWETVSTTMRYWASVEGIRHVVLDHLSFFAATEGDERKTLDRIMKDMSRLAQETLLDVYLITHLTRAKDGPPHEEGGRTKQDQMRGSNAIGMWSHFILGLEGNTQAPEKHQRLKRTLRVIKDRNTGRGTGDTISLMWKESHSRLYEIGEQGDEHFENQEESSAGY